MTEHTTTLKERSAVFVYGDRRRTGDIRGVLRLELRLVAGGHYGVYGRRPAVAAMYCAFIFSFTELTTAIPHAGGPFAYAYRAFGPTGGFIAGFATLIVRPAGHRHGHRGLPQRAVSGAGSEMGRLRRLRDLYDAQYSRRRHRRHLRADRHPAGHLRAAGVHGRGRPRLLPSHFTTNGWAGADSFSGPGAAGMFAAIPFAIWFFLAIEGPPWRPKKDPQRTIPRARAAAF